MNMFQNATISGGNTTFNLVQQQWSMTINNCSSFRYYVWQLSSAIWLALEMMNERTPTFFLNIFTQELFNWIYVGKYTINIFFMLTPISLF
jgi:expansin (peptidoglycan-binding protein)